MKLSSNLFQITLTRVTRGPDDLLTLTSDLVKSREFVKNVSIWGERLQLLATCEMDEEERKTMMEAEMKRALSSVPAKVSDTPFYH